MQTRYTYTAVILMAALAAVAVFRASNSDLSAKSDPIRQTTVASGQVAGASTAAINKPAPKLLMPIPGGLARVTKKPYGLFVTPENSPVPDDIFNGYHTGIDFETYNSEQNTAIPITAACEGTALLKEWASGYGGVFVQSCKIDGEDVTVIYGHLDLASITPEIGQTLHAGDKIGYLGAAGSPQTDGRRKHLHFDIHKGTEINILGYVPDQGDLAGWIDPIKLLE